MINIAAISYLNSVPFIYGLKNSKIWNHINLQLDFPSACARKIINFDVDLALVPVTVLAKMPQSYIISDYCIGSDGHVDTVCVYSDVPIHLVESIFLDYQSSTSVALLKILLNEYWCLNPELISSSLGFESKIKGKIAGLVIGDRAFSLNTKFNYVYDLSAIWKEMTGLPFVFALWVANKELSTNFIKVFNTSIMNGIRQIDKALVDESCQYLTYKNQSDYLNNKISYILDSKKREAIKLFLSKI